MTLVKRPTQVLVNEFPLWLNFRIKYWYISFGFFQKLWVTPRDWRRRSENRGRAKTPARGGRRKCQKVFFSLKFMSLLIYLPH